MQYTAANMLVKAHDFGESGIFARVHAEQAGWQYLNMAALRLNKGGTFAGHVGEPEHVSVLPGGRCNIHRREGDFLKVGGRGNLVDWVVVACLLRRDTCLYIVSRVV